VADGCAARALDDPARFPVKAAKVAKPVRHGTAYWIEVDGHVLLERRPPSGLLGGMLGLPGSAWTPANATARGTIRHVFTHFELRLTVAAAYPATRPPVPGEWHPVAAIADAGLPTLFARAAAAVLAARPAHSVQLETAA
jgi:A/G-specific adenine glycosylase